MSWIRRNLKIVAPLTVVAAVAVAYLAFGVFGVHTLFIDDTVDEDGPVFASGATEGDVGEAPATSGGGSAGEAPATTKVDKLGAGGEVQASLDAVDAADADAVADTDTDAGADADDAAAPVESAVPSTPAPVAAPQIVTVAGGMFIPRGRYSGEGTARVLNDGSEQRFLRFENFSTDNGPDLNVYLVNADAAADSGVLDDDVVDLGDLKGNVGDQNYEIPPDVDLSVYDTVVVWCVRFSTPFTAADLR